ncbi:hypothetical protein LCGC14_2111720 [marine sediment metagenome]|uniref:Uncharacterized protein n=1 Tax=marine sediment metagenome TaxID=412755 RepID=A0A0F9E6Y8_9ZZZZ
MPKPDHSQGITTTSSLGSQTGSEEEIVELTDEEKAAVMKSFADDPTDGEEDE